MSDDIRPPTTSAETRRAAVGLAAALSLAVAAVLVLPESKDPSKLALGKLSDKALCVSGEALILAGGPLGDHLDPGEAERGRPVYARVTIESTDGQLPPVPGLRWVPGSQQPAPCPESGAQLELAVGKGAPWPCACAPAQPAKSSVPCEWVRPSLDGKVTWEAAPPGLTLQPGRWAGDCRRKSCTELAGEPDKSLPIGPSMPPECE